MLPFAELKCGKTVVFNCKIHELFSKPVPAGLNSSVGTLTAGTLPIISTGLTFTIAEPSYNKKQTHTHQSIIRKRIHEEEENTISLRNLKNLHVLVSI